jgi:hypothetical protein
VGIPHALRSLAGVPAFAILTAFGVTETLALLSGRRKSALIVVLIVVESTFVLHFLYVYAFIYPRESRQAWQSGIVEALRYGLDNSGPGDTIWISEAAGEMIVPPNAVSPATVFTAFCARIDPAQFQKRGLDGSRFRVVLFSSDWNLLLTQASPAPTFIIAFVGEMPGRKPVAVFAERPRPQLAVGIYAPQPQSASAGRGP